MIRFIYQAIDKLSGFKRKADAFYFRAILRQSNVDCNVDKVNIFGSCKLSFAKGAHVKLGDGVVVRGGTRATIDYGAGSKIVVADNATLTIGCNSGMSNTILHCHERIEIGDNVNIGSGCMVMDTNFHSTDWAVRRDRAKDIMNAKTKPVHIGDDVFIGARSIICKGVTIGEKSMVAAGSVVVSDIGKGELWGGNPAVFIKKLTL